MTVRRLRAARWLAPLLLGACVATARQGPDPQGGTLTGRVTGTAGRSLPGATVAIAGTPLGTRTDAEGRYRISGVPAGERTVRAYFVGHVQTTRTVVVGRGAEVALDLDLAPVPPAPVPRDTVLAPLDDRRCAFGSLTAAGCEMYDVSIVELIATPERYHGKRVHVIGFLRLEFEGMGIYLSEEDYRRGINRNGLWVRFEPGVLEDPRGVDRRYVILVGTFNADDGGHLGRWSGTIEQITRVAPWH